MEEKVLMERMLEESKEFKKLYLQHQKCEKELEKLKKKKFLTEEEKLKEKEIKKKKLAIKDKMYYMMTEYQKAHN